MKASKYNMFWTLEDGSNIAFNSMTCALAEIDNNFMEILNNIDNIKMDELDDEKKKLVEDMLMGNFITQDCFDELKVVKYRHLAGKFSSSGFGLTIAPTLACNFACPYCYESPKKGMMSQEVQDAVLELVKEAAEKRKDVSITWYGGEPLLAKDIVFGLSEKMIKICEENGAKYGAYIVTNGYLIDDEIVEKMKAAKIGGAQITIDGPPHIHNKRRILKNSDKPTFDIILGNVKKLMANGIKNIGIRINVDKENIEHLEALLDTLKENGLQDVSIGLGHVNAYTDACTSIAESCMNTEEYAMKNVEYQRMLHNKGFKAQGYPYYPGIKANYCCADATSSYVLDHEGYMYKCWNDVGTVVKAVGQITKLKEAPNEEMYMMNVNYVLWSPFNYQECIECNLLPICMGGCPYNGAKNGLKPECEKWKYNLEQSLKAIYTQKRDCPEEEACDCCGCK